MIITSYYSEKIQMLQGFLSIDKSPIVDFFKKGFSTARLFTVVTFATVSISTGITPFSIGNISNSQPAFAGDRIIGQSSNGCAYFRMHQAWWGQYMYLNKCATLQVADQFGIFQFAMQTAVAKVPSFYKLPLQATSFYTGSMRTQLYHCAANNGQAYLRFYQTPFNTIAPYVSCN